MTGFRGEYVGAGGDMNRQEAMLVLRFEVGERELEGRQWCGLVGRVECVYHACVNWEWWGECKRMFLLRDCEEVRLCWGVSCCSGEQPAAELRP